MVCIGNGVSSMLYAENTWGALGVFTNIFFFKGIIWDLGMVSDCLQNKSFLIFTSRVNHVLYFYRYLTF